MVTAVQFERHVSFPVDERGLGHIGGGSEDGDVASPVRKVCVCEPCEGRDGENRQNESHLR